MYENLSDMELDNLKSEKRKQIDALYEQITKENNVIKLINQEIALRDKWNRDKVTKNVLEKIENHKSHLSEGMYNLLHSEVSRIYTSDRKESNRYKFYSMYMNTLVVNFSNIISMKIRNKLGKQIQYRNTKYELIFNFDHKNKIIKRSLSNTIFSESKQSVFSFYIDKKAIRELNAILLKQTKKEYSDYNDLIDDLISMAKFIDSELENYVTLYVLSIAKEI